MRGNSLAQGAPSFYTINAVDASHFLGSWLGPAAITYIQNSHPLGRLLLSYVKIQLFFFILLDYMLIVNNIDNMPLTRVKKVKIISNLTFDKAILILIGPSLTY